ncbi:MAG: TIGR04222 domain-containing membrane protein [Deltaproteobacteria bacterium]|nr:MAG: TIGR04222 domain-containing membrane protein [Deltaproteobacteria bacterium]
MKALTKIALSVLIVLLLAVGLSFAQNTAKKIWTEGVEYAAQGKFKEAKEEFEKALKVDPSHTRAKIFLEVIEDVHEQKTKGKTALHIFKGTSFIIKGDFNQAISHFNKAIELNPEYAIPYIYRGQVYGGRGLYSEAIADYNKALEIDPRAADSPFDTYYWRGRAWMEKGKIDRAIIDYSRALERNPRNANAYNSLAWLLATCSDAKYRDGVRAVELADKAVELAPQYYGFLDTLAAAYAEASLFQDSITTQEKAIALLKKGGRTGEIHEFMKRLNSYRAHKPWREKYGRNIIIEKLIKIPGPEFLIYFTALALLCIFVAWYWANADGSTQYPLPKLTQFDPIAIAAFIGGRASVIRTAVFRLWHQNLVEIKSSKKSWGRRKKPQIESLPSPKRALSPIEEEIYQFLKEPQEPKALLKDADLRSRIERHLEPTYSELERLHLTRTGTDRFRARMAPLFMGLVLCAVGGTKLYFGFIRGRPSLFLVILLLVSLVFLSSKRFRKPSGNMTRLGRRYFKEIRELFDGVNKESAKTGKLPEGIDAAISVAIFGTGALAGTSLYGNFVRAFPVKGGGWSSGGGCGSCGGGCGGGCGGSCGGGCGGCGD